MKKALLVLMVLALAVTLVAGCSGESADNEEPAADEAQDSATTAQEDADETADPAEFTATSSAYSDGGTIPAKYCNTGVEGGENVSVPLAWEGAPADTKSFALIMVDNHEVANEWVHWMVVGIPPSTTSLAEAASAALPAGATELLSTNGATGYQGPQPPPGSGDHEYETIIFALDVDTVDVAEDATYGEFIDAMDAHHLAEASVSGFFGR